MTTKRGRWVLVPIACAIALIVCIVGPRYGSVLWGWAVYGGWKPSPKTFLTTTSDGLLRGIPVVVGPDGLSKVDGSPLTYYKVRRKRFSWLPGEDVETVPTTREEYKTLLKRHPDG